MAEWMTVKEAADFLKISERQVLNRIHTGRLKAIRNGRRWLVHTSLSEPSSEADKLPIGNGNEAVLKPDETVEILKNQLQKREMEVEDLRRQLEAKDRMLDDASQRHDTIVLQLTRQLEQSQHLLEYHKSPWWRRWLGKHRKAKEEEQ